MQLWGASARHEGAGAAREEVGNDTSVTSTLFRARHHTQASQCESRRCKGGATARTHVVGDLRANAEDLVEGDCRHHATSYASVVCAVAFRGGAPALRSHTPTRSRGRAYANGSGRPSALQAASSRRGWPTFLADARRPCARTAHVRQQCSDAAQARIPQAATRGSPPRLAPSPSPPVGVGRACAPCRADAAFRRTPRGARAARAARAAGAGTIAARTARTGDIRARLGAGGAGARRPHRMRTDGEEHDVCEEACSQKPL